MYENYEWLKTQKEAWMYGQMAWPVQVEIVSIDEAKQEAVVKTKFQEGRTDFDKLYKTESDCPCR